MPEIDMIFTMRQIFAISSRICDFCVTRKNGRFTVTHQSARAAQAAIGEIVFLLRGLH